MEESERSFLEMAPPGTEWSIDWGGEDGPGSSRGPAPAEDPLVQVLDTCLVTAARLVEWLKNRKGIPTRSGPWEERLYRRLEGGNLEARKLPNPTAVDLGDPGQTRVFFRLATTFLELVLERLRERGITVREPSSCLNVTISLGSPESGASRRNRGENP